MQVFTQLIFKLNETSNHLEAVELISKYFKTVRAKDAVWGLYFLLGRGHVPFIKADELRMLIDSELVVTLLDPVFDREISFFELAKLINDQGFTNFNRSLGQLMGGDVSMLSELSPVDKNKKIPEMFEKLNLLERVFLIRVLLAKFSLVGYDKYAIESLAKVIGTQPDWVERNFPKDWKPDATKFLKMMFMPADFKANLPAGGLKSIKSQGRSVNTIKVFDAVLMYQEQESVGGSVRQAVKSQYTFGIWEGDQLISVAKTNQGFITPEMVTEIDKICEDNIIERFVPVRQIEPIMVFTITCLGVKPSDKNKSGVILETPRILKWNKDKKPKEADSVEKLQGFI